MNEVVWQERPVHPHQPVHIHHSQHHQVLLTNGQLPQSGEMSQVQKNQAQQSNNHSSQHQNQNNNNNNSSVRSQDDAMVGYFFQRPQTDPDFQNYGKSSRWAIGDDSVIEARQNDSSELENDFQALALETDGYASTKKIWGMEENSSTNKNDDDKGLFLSDTQWGRADTTWSTGGHDNASNHAVSQPIMVNSSSRRSGSYPGSDGANMLSPRSNDTGGLGVKMVEYVLGGSPTSKESLERMTSRLQQSGLNDGKNKKLTKGRYDETSKMMNKDVESSAIQTNGIIQNGLDEDKGFNRTPGSHQVGVDDLSDDLSKNHGLVNDLSKLKPNDGIIPISGMSGMLPGHGPHGFGPDAFEHIGMDPLQFSNDYSHIMHSIDSPGILDYNASIYQQRPGQAQGQLSLIAPHQQQFNLAQQQGQGMPHHPTGMGPGTGTNGNPFPPPQNPYYQDPFSAASIGHIIPAGPPPMMAQYYGLPPWGMYPGMIQGGQVQPGQPGAPPHVQQQQQIIRNNRPLTPQPGPGGDNSGTPQTIQPGQYQMLPHGYYDQNGLMTMGNTPTPRGINPPPMRLMPTMIMNPAHAAAAAAAANAVNQSGTNNPIRMMPGNGQPVNQNQVGPTSALFSSNASNPANNPLYTSANNSNIPYPSSVNSNLISNNANANQIGFNPNTMNPRNAQVQAYGNSALGPIGASIQSGINLGNSSPRRESFDARRDAGLGMFSASLDNQFSRHLAGSHKNGQFYGLGPGIAPSPGPIGLIPPSQSLTPPPSLDGSSGSLNALNPFSGRLISAAPGAESKYMVRNGGNMFGSSNSIFTNRILPKNPSLEKSSGRSRLLEDFRNNRFPNLQLRDLTDHIVEFSQDQHGSRFIQQKLERATAQEKQMVFNEILGSAYNLMTDVFGNYVIQKFFEFGTPEQKQALAQKVRGHVLQLALQMYGCRVIQKALESIPQDQQKDVVKELDGHVLKCVKDQNGNHVVQKCIECVDPVALQFIINAFQGQVFSLSTHPYGCRVIQRILEHCTSEQTAPILEELHQHTEQLVQDQYGNYVVQHVLEHGRPEDKSKIIGMVRGKVLQLSQHKFASNVVERCVTHASRNERALLIEEVCSYNDSSTHSALYTMMKDQYANYVVQKMIEVAENQQRKLLLQRIRPHMPALRKYTYGKHILAKLEKYMMKSNDLGPIGGPSNGTL